MENSAIVTQGLRKQYGNTVVVEDLNLILDYGELFGFLGPNGAGKSTTIKMLVGLLRPTAGGATVGGYDVLEDSPARKQAIGYLAERPFLYEQLTGYEFLRLCGGLYGLPDGETQQRSELLLETLELTTHGNNLIESYSHGMRQKIGLAAALLHDPPILFLDEPTNGLDPLSARRVKDLLQKHVRRGRLVFVSTHILEVAERICDRLGIIHRGRLIAMGTFAELQAQARSEGSTLEDVFLVLTQEAASNRSNAL